MKKDMDGPAGTRMMGIVHDALRRDLARTLAAVATAPPPQRRHALAAHVGWMMDFLRTLAEEGLWLMDGLDAQRRAVVEAEVPWVSRMIVLYGFGPGYRRRAAARWAGLPVGAAS